ncbi:unnamed protein product, partial [Mesorhabditis belari]|uniref:PRELI/MSF1 domain-containing protein n=1 Tax=Mesorhabditis belari TaxID=2138241 RepID=A0AAF3F6R4_9BILA
MKIWTSEHVFEHPWSTVVNAAWRKYPNPMNGAVTNMDVISQQVDEGVVKSERIIQSQFSIPSWATKLTGFSGTQYSHEYSVIDPSKQTMSLTTRNMNGVSFLKVDERLTYVPHTTDPNKTILKQEAIISVKLPAFADYCEKTFLSVYSSNATKGRSGIEWVIGQFRKEYDELTNKVSSEVHEMGEKMMGAFHKVK